MFVNSVFSALDSLSQQTFVNDKAILMADDSVCRFLYEMRTPNQASGFSHWEQVFSTGENVDPPADGVVGLRLKKMALTSTQDNKVNPEFILTIKKATIVALTKLASNWKELKSEYLNREGLSIVENAQGSEVPKAVFFLKIISELYLSVKDTLKIDPFGSVYMTGKWKDIQRFSTLMRQETLQNQCLSLRQLAIRSVIANMELHFRRFQYLPQELQDEIVKECPFLPEKK